MASILASVLGGYALDKIGGAIGLANGGVVPKTGIYKLHAGELVVPAKIVSKKAPPPNATSMKGAVRKAKGKAPKKATTAVGKKPRTAKQLANDKRLGALAKGKKNKREKALAEMALNIPAPRTKRGTGTYAKTGKFKGVAVARRAKKAYKKGTAIIEKAD